MYKNRFIAFSRFVSRGEKHDSDSGKISSAPTLL